MSRYWLVSGEVVTHTSFYNEYGIKTPETRREPKELGIAALTIDEAIRAANLWIHGFEIHEARDCGPFDLDAADVLDEIAGPAPSPAEPTGSDFTLTDPHDDAPGGVS